MKKSIFAILIISFIFISATDDKSEMNAHSVEAMFTKTLNGVYASKYETTNRLYKLFLADLKSTGNLHDIQLAEINGSGWLEGEVYIEEYEKAYTADKKYDEYPVVNISFEGATLFCAWLTQKYNSFPDRKFKEASFRLSSVEEWEIAARGKATDLKFACGNTLVNEDGAYLSNYHHKVLGQDPSLMGINDNADITAPTKSYWPNSFGIYNMSGNVAEMVLTKGESKGGGFKSGEESLQINSIGTYAHSASDLGFRVFMQVK